jgi:hypothetical protein
MPHVRLRGEISMTDIRLESDSLGQVEVPGGQTLGRAERARLVEKLENEMHCAMSSNDDLSQESTAPRKDRAALPGEVVLVMQGGGAPGCYQAGVYHALHEAGIEPDSQLDGITQKIL